MTNSLKNRRILITGAAAGMGRAIAELFAAEGASLALLDRNGDGVKEVAAKLGAHGFACDVSQRAETVEVVGKAAAALGGLDGVVNGAGVLIVRPFAELEPELWDRMIAVNLTGPYDIIRAALPFLQAAESATIVNIASMSAIMASTGTAGYCSTKAGLVMFTKSLAFELGPKIRANAICPGIIQTEMTRYLWEDPKLMAVASERIGVKRLGLPEDIAQSALFLTTTNSSFITGTIIQIDGGGAVR